MQITPDEMIKVQDYLRRTFRQPCHRRKTPRPGIGLYQILLNGEFLGICYKNEEDGETSFDFNMSILDIDLEG